MLKARLRSIRRTAFTAFLLLATQTPIARSDPASCLFRFSAYVKELDPLLAETRYSLVPITELNDRYFPFVDCDPDALKKIASRSRFFEQTTYDERSQEYLFMFSSEDVWVTFTYRSKERTTFLPGALFFKKF